MRAGAGGGSSAPVTPVSSVLSGASARAATFVLVGLLYARFLFLPNPIPICGTRQWAGGKAEAEGTGRPEPWGKGGARRATVLETQAGSFTVKGLKEGGRSTAPIIRKYKKKKR